MSELQKQIQEARPNLKVVSPISHWIVLVMGWFNIVLGLSMIFAVDSERFVASLFLVNDYMPFWLWGWIFVTVGAVKLYALHSNNWELSRRSLMLGVSIKAAWMVALTIRTFVLPGTAFLNLTWIALALIQMGAYIWFMPPNIQTNKQEKKQKD